MARVTYSHRLDLNAVRALLTSPQGGVVRNLMGRGLLVETQAKRNLEGIGGPKRIDTGRLRASISTQLVTRNGVPTVLVGTNVRYALMVHNGTGIYGPHARMIKPRQARRLKFKPKGLDKFVYAKAVRGMRPNRFLTNALSAARR